MSTLSLLTDSQVILEEWGDIITIIELAQSMSCFPAWYSHPWTNPHLPSSTHVFGVVHVHL
jgi:hypothetical protein